MVDPCRARNIAAEAGEDFKWFSGLGFPDVMHAPYVRVTWLLQPYHKQPQNVRFNGFLLMTNGPIFTVLTLDLDQMTFFSNAAGTNDYGRADYDKLDLQQSADSIVQSLRRLPTGGEDLVGFSDPVTRADVFVLGWACWRNGLADQAAELYKQAQTLPNGEGSNESASSFRISIEKDLAHTMMDRAFECFGDPSISRPQLLVMFNSIVTNYPDSEYLKDALETAAALRKIIAEDQAHAMVVPTNLDGLPVQVRVRELIYQLRDDQNWRSVRTNTPDDQLVNLGYAAVPQLIETLEDPTLTRTVVRWGPDAFSHYILNVGDCAVFILQRITGTLFLPYTSSSMSKEEVAAQTKKAAEAWWARFQKEGEKQMLIDALRIPDSDAPAQAEILCKKYPDVAVQTLERGIRAADTEGCNWIRAELVRQLSFIEDPRVATFLNDEMIHSPMPRSRAEAASQLLRLKKGDPIAAMTREWQGLKGRGFNAEDDESEFVREFLANADSPVAIKALGSGLQQRPVNTRLAVVEALSQPGSTKSAATWAAIEELLVKELEDTAREIAMNGSIDGPRVCDMAGATLAGLWTNRYAFDFSAPLKIRDRQRVQCINIWRQSHGGPQLPLPSERSTCVKPVDATRVRDTVSVCLRTNTWMFSRVASLLTHYIVLPERQTRGLVPNRDPVFNRPG